MPQIEINDNVTVNSCFRTARSLVKEITQLKEMYEMYVKEL